LKVAGNRKEQHLAAPVVQAPVQESESLQRAGIGNAAIAAWLAAAPRDTSDFAGDCARYSRFWESSTALLARLPAKPAREAQQAEAAERIKQVAREARTRFLRAHIEAIYDRLTHNRSRFIRVEQLVYDAAALVPGLTPTRAQVAAESACLQRDKEGWRSTTGYSSPPRWQIQARDATFATRCCYPTPGRPSGWQSWKRKAAWIWVRPKSSARAEPPT